MEKSKEMRKSIYNLSHKEFQNQVNKIINRDYSEYKDEFIEILKRREHRIEFNKNHRKDIFSPDVSIEEFDKEIDNLLDGYSSDELLDSLVDCGLEFKEGSSMELYNLRKKNKNWMEIRLKDVNIGELIRKESNK